METTGFRLWLANEKKYSKRVVSNIISRLNRANRIHTVYIDDLYIFELEHKDCFQQLSTTVRSQLRKSVKLFFEYNDLNK